MLRPALYVVAAYQLALGLFMAVAPGTFFSEVGPFGARNDHYVRDMASWELALAAVAFVAARRPAWRAPVLCLAAVHFGLHALNHLADVDAADPHWVGLFDLVSLAAGTALLAWLWRRAARA
ncbi:MAG TPA: hypothetical protein VF533_23090 [Solirubrobacteraceae bacterium]|jgi:hypothetical protein